MITQFEQNLYLALAHTLVHDVGEEYGHIQALAFDFTSNTSSGTSNTAFQRAGTTASQKGYSLPADLAALIRNSFTQAQVPGQLQGADNSFLTDLLTRDNANGPGLNLLQVLQQLSAGDFTGADTLTSIAKRNPFSQDYAEATNGLYNRNYEIARSNAQTGPMNVRGGQARQAFELADLDQQAASNRFKEVHDAGMQESSEIQKAIQVNSTIEQMRRGVSMGAQQAQVAGEHARTSESLDASNAVARSKASNLANLQMAGELLGTQGQSTNENLKGSGQQIQQGSSQGWNAGITCCFIFLEAFNGELPKVVRQGRDDFNTPARRKGYCWMSSWLVPLMKQSKLTRLFVNFFIVEPFVTMGKVHYNEDTGLVSACKGLLYLPYCFGWLYLWSAIGHVKGECPQYA